MLLDFYCYYLSGAQIKFPGSPDSLHGCNTVCGQYWAYEGRSSLRTKKYLRLSLLAVLEVEIHLGSQFRERRSPNVVCQW